MSPVSESLPSVFVAKVVAPIHAPPIVDGAVLVRDGRTLALGTLDQLHTSFADDLRQARWVDTGHSLLTPGLVNAHTHLELSSLSNAQLKSASIGDWILQLGATVRAHRESRANSIELAVREGVRQCLRFGVTVVGDISQQMTQTRAILNRSPIRVVSFGEALGLGAIRDRFSALLDSASDRTHESERLTIGISPHAPYTVDRAGFEECVHRAQALEMPIATHLAEHPEEEQFLRNLTGMLRDVWERSGSWGGDVPTFEGSPVAFAHAVGLLQRRALLAHANYCDTRDLAILARGNASVVWCPRTHQYFGHPTHRFREMLSMGINVAIGTDSCASSHDLNLLADAQLVLERDAGVDARTLWEMMTLRAAHALGLESDYGSIEPGKRADFVAFPISPTDSTNVDTLLRAVITDCRAPFEVWINGISTREMESAP
jgi:cytosine/adenosine deaminase-related metal-dependent hydrolase